jgi:pimeloyl-ACP methyl ester carboxylesterase
MRGILGELFDGIYLEMASGGPAGPLLCSGLPRSTRPGYLCRMPFLILDRERIFYRQLGHAKADRSEPALMLIHGAGGSSLHYVEFLRKLARRRRVVALDLPGHGKSTPLSVGAIEPRELIARYAELAAEVAERVGLGRYLLCGHSMGGAVALRMALRYRDRLAGLLLIATAARLPVSRALIQMLDRDFEMLPRTFAASGYSSASNPDQVQLWAAQQLACDKPQLLADFEACRAFDVRAALASVDIPAVAVIPKDDLLIAPRVQRRFAEQLSGCELWEVERAGHFVQRERPDRVLAALERLDVLAKQRRRIDAALCGA